MMNLWNSTVSNKSKIIINGDFVFGNNKNVEDIVSKLNGYKILILGNHDQFTPGFYHSIGIQEVSRYPIFVNEFLLISHRPQYVSENTPYVNIFAHVHTNPEYNTITAKSACVSAERWNYTPIRLSHICKKIQEIRGE